MYDVIAGKFVTTIRLQNIVYPVMLVQWLRISKQLPVQIAYYSQREICLPFSFDIAIM